MLISHNNNTSINNLVRTDIHSCYWNNTPKTAKADMFCQNKEGVSVSFNLFPILIYSSNSQKFTETDSANGFLSMWRFPDL